MGVPKDRSHVRTSPVTISISEISKNVNPKDEDFKKYIPKQFFENSDVQHSLPRNSIGKSREDLKAMVEKGEITLDDAFDSLIDQHGALSKGENPKVDVTFPKKISKKENVSRYARTVCKNQPIFLNMYYGLKYVLHNNSYLFLLVFVIFFLFHLSKP